MMGLVYTASHVHALFGQVKAEEFAFAFSAGVLHHDFNLDNLMFDGATVSVLL